MSAARQLEQELETELQGELGFAGELEQGFALEHEQEAEHEAFFNHLAAMADRGGRSQALRRIALTAARQALRANRGPKWPVIEGEFGELEQELGEMESGIGFELATSSSEAEQIAAMMEHEGHAAAEAANEQEAAEHFLPLIGLAAKFVLPKLAGMAAKKLGGQMLARVGSQAIRRVAPQLTRGVANVARTLFRNRTTRPLLHAVPRIARSTVAQLGRRIANGQRVTPQLAVRTLAQQTARTISNPRALAQTYRRSLALDQRYHQRARRVLGRPAGPPVRAANDAAASPAAATIGSTVPVVPLPSAGPAASTCGCNSAASQVSAMGMAPRVLCPTCGR